MNQLNLVEIYFWIYNSSLSLAVWGPHWKVNDTHMMETHMMVGHTLILANQMCYRSRNVSDAPDFNIVYQLNIVNCNILLDRVYAL